VVVVIVRDEHVPHAVEWHSEPRRRTRYVGAAVEQEDTVDEGTGVGPDLVLGVGRRT
jgi:hypothetical protein